MSKISLHPLNELVKKGLLHRVVCKETGLELYGYTRECEFKRQWNDHTKLCRSLIVKPIEDGMAEIVCKTFTKFFNVGQTPETQPVALPKESFTATEKLDGSFIQIFFYDGRWRISSKGSFENEYVAYARKCFEEMDMKSLPRQLCFACEVVLPPEEDAFRRVISHKPGLYLLAAFNVYSDFKEQTFTFAKKFWEKCGGRAARIIDVANIKDLLELRLREKTTEGWVVRFESGLRVKVKTIWWFEVSQFIQELQPKQVKTFILGNWEYEDSVWIEMFPKEFRSELKQTVAEIRQQFNTEYDRIVAKFNELQCPDRKEFVSRVRTDPNAWALFRLYDRKDFAWDLMEKLPVG